MKKCVLLFSLIVSVCTAEPLPPGKYMMSSPAIFSSGGGEHAAEWLCEMQVTGSVHRLWFLVMGGDSYIELELLPRGKVSFEDARIVIGASGKKLKGSGEIIDDRRVKGKVTAIGGAGGFPLLERKKSEWYLRPATEEEIVQGLLKGLDRIEKRFSQKGRPPTQEEIEQKLYLGYGYGYSSSDRSKIVEMLHEGTLLFTNSQFMLKKKVVDERSETPSNSSEVIVEKIPIRSEADLKKDLFADDIETITDDTQQHVRLSAPVTKVKEKAEPVPIVKQEVPTKPQTEKKPLAECTVSTEEPSTPFSAIIFFGIGCVVLIAAILTVRRFWR